MSMNDAILLKTALTYFEQSVRDGSIRRAAHNLNVASSAINRQLLLLEDHFGTPLFERLPRGIRPTEAGTVLLGYIRRWQEDVSQLGLDLADLKGGAAGTIRIAAGETAISEVLPPALNQFRMFHPLVDFTLIAGPNHVVLGNLTARDVDFCVAFDVEPAPQFEIVKKIERPLGVICRPDHPLARLHRVTLSDCAPFPFVIPGTEWMRQSGVRKLFEGRNAPKHIVARTERPTNLKALVRSGLGIAFLSGFGAERERAEGRLVWIPLARETAPQSTVSLVTLKDRELSEATMRLIELVAASMK